MAAPGTSLDDFLPDTCKCIWKLFNLSLANGLRVGRTYQVEVVMERFYAICFVIGCIMGIIKLIREPKPTEAERLKVEWRGW